MKKILLFALTAGLAISCNKLADDAFKITGTIDGVENGKTVILEVSDEAGTTLIPVDTVVVKDGKFEFTGKTLEPSLHFLQVQDVQGKVIFVLENGEINVKIYKDSVNKSVIGCSFNNEQFANYNKEQTFIQNKINAYRTANMEKMQLASTNKDTVTMNSLRDGFIKIQNELTAFNYVFADKNPKAFISVLMLENLFYQQDVDINKINKIYTSLDETVKNTKPGKKIKELISNFSAAEVGNIAPEFSAPDPSGKIVSLKESLGKVTIIDFWASWCKPCRLENPNVVALYNTFHSKGLNIIGISLDKEGEGINWKQAIEVDKLTWTQVSNLQYWNDPIAKKYNVKGIPATFILDASGKIVAKDLRGEELIAKIQELLSK